MSSNHLFLLVVVWFIKFLSSASGSNNRTSLTPFAAQPNLSIRCVCSSTRNQCIYAITIMIDIDGVCIFIEWSKISIVYAPFPRFGVASPFPMLIAFCSTFSWSQPIRQGIFLAHSMISHFHSNCWQFLLRRVSSFSSVGFWLLCENADEWHITFDVLLLTVKLASLISMAPFGLLIPNRFQWNLFCYLNGKQHCYLNFTSIQKFWNM